MTYAHQGLASDSEVYVNLAGIYDVFSRAEDFPCLILQELKTCVGGSRTLLDLGCGSGKYLSLLAPHAKDLLGVDASAAQLAVAAANNAQHRNVSMLQGDIAEIDLGGRSFSNIISTWVLHTMRDKSKRLHAINRAFDRLESGGNFYLIENDSSGEFEEIRNRTTASAEYNNWLQDVAGFSLHKKIQTEFVFCDTAEARSVFGQIWGSEVAKKIRSHIVRHNVVMFRKQKS